MFPRTTAEPEVFVAPETDLGGSGAQRAPAGVSYETMEVTPTMALAWLEAAAPEIRERARLEVTEKTLEARRAGRKYDGPTDRLDETIDSYAAMMKRDVDEKANWAALSDEEKAKAEPPLDIWVQNAQPIIFDRDGRLIDGAKRLGACVRAEVPFRTLVARGVHADTLHTIDQHRHRSYVGVLEARGVASAGAVMRTMGKLVRIENGWLGKRETPISWARYEKLYDAEEKRLEEAVALSERHRGSVLHSTPRPVLCFMALKSGWEREIDRFLIGLSDDEIFEADNPTQILGNQLRILNEVPQRDIDGFPVVDRNLALSILAFNDFVAGKSVKRPYFWEPDLGKPAEGETAAGGKRKRKRKAAPDDAAVTGDKPVPPPNFGLPAMTGWPGLPEAKMETTPDQRVADEGEHILKAAEAIEESDRAAEVVGDVEVRMRTVTREMAERWLERDINRSNRKIQDTQVKAIMRDIINGSWMVNAQPICFTGDPFVSDEEIKRTKLRLLNGQHRLHALVAANIAEEKKLGPISIDIPIAINVKEYAFATYDVHSRRTTLGSVAKADVRVLAAAAKFQWREDEKYKVTSRVAPSATEIKNTIERHPELAENFPVSRRRGMAEIGSAGVMTYFISRVKREREDLAEDYLAKLETGLNIERGDPVIRLRAARVGGRDRLNRKQVLDLLLENWAEYQAWMDAKTASPKLL